MSLEMSTSRVTATGVEVPVEQIRQEHGAELDAIARFRRVTNYLAAAQIYLKDNVLRSLAGPLGNLAWHQPGLRASEPSDYAL